MVDLSQLPGGLVAVLAPVLPYLLEVGGATWDKAKEALGEKAVELAQDVWGKLRGKVAEKPAAQEAAHDLAERPDDQRAQGALEAQLEKILRAEPNLTAELARLLEAAGERTWNQAYLQGIGAIAQSGGIAAGAGGVAVRGNVNGGIRLDGEGRQPREGDE